MTAYQTAANILGDHDSRKVANNSYLVRLTEDSHDREGHPAPAGTIAYRLHGTYVVLYHPDGAVELNSGGWRTVTTKDRINHCLHDLRDEQSFYRVWSNRGVWGLYRNGLLIAEFADGMIIDVDGTISGAMSAAEMAKRNASNAKLSKLLRHYIAGLTPAIVAEVMEGNDAGDCFYCKGMVQRAELVNGKLEITGPCTDNDHLWSHLEKRYYMRTTFANAVLAGRFGSPEYVWSLIHGCARGEVFGGIPTVNDMLTTSLTKYFNAALRAV